MGKSGYATAPRRRAAVAWLCAGMALTAVTLAQAQEAQPAPQAQISTDAEPYRTLPLPAKAEATQLETVVVIGEGIAPYVAPAASSATKSDAPLIETPQSVSVITRQQLEDQGVQTVQDALRYSAGVYADAYGLDSRSDGPLVRGTSFTEYLDGLRRSFTYNSNTRVEPYTLHSIEVVRGPASVLYGQGPPGGIVAMQSKRPQREAMTELRAEYGSYERRQLGLDSTGRITGDGSLLYRLIAVGRESDTQVDYVRDDRWLVQPSLSWEPSDSLRWTLLGNFQRDFSGSTTTFLPWSGTALPNRNGQIPTNRFVSEPGFDRYDTEQSSGTSLLEWNLAPAWTFRQNLRYSDSGSDYRTMYPNVYFNPFSPLNPRNPYIGPAQRNVLRIAGVYDTQAHALTTDQQLQWRGETFGIEHLVLGGFEYNDGRLSGHQSALSIPDILLQIPFDLYDPVYGRNYRVPGAPATPDQRLRQSGVYLQDQLKLGGLVVLLSGRRDWASTETQGLADDSNARNSWRTGLLYRFESGFAPYASIANSFQPTAGTDGDGVPYKPLLGRQVEGGLKYQPNASMLFAAAAFELDERNRLVASDSNPLVQKQVDAHTRGYEFEAQATAFDQLDLLASYTWLDAHADDAGVEKSLAGVAEQMASAWANWHIMVTGRTRLSFGAGVRYIGKREDEGREVHLPAVTLFDALAALDAGPWRLAVNASNLGDKVYVATCLERGDCFYGPRRVISGSLVYRF
ncbi:MAG: TonB-dependent siderophore receptor [Solimonas sp.]